MRRNIVIVSVLICLSIIMSSGCTCVFKDGSTCRGIGYEFINCFNSCGEIFGGICSGIEITYMAEEGIDYSKPEVTFARNGNGGRLRVNIEKYATESIYVTIEICVVQDGILLGSYEYRGYLPMMIDESVTFNWSKYNQNGGKVYCFVNSIEALLR